MPQEFTPDQLRYVELRNLYPETYKNRAEEIERQKLLTVIPMKDFTAALLLADFLWAIGVLGRRVQAAV